MKKHWGFILTFGLFLAGCAIEAVETVPEEIVVTRVESPYADGIWIDSEYNWINGAYVALPGHWERSYGRHWNRGHWKHTRRGYHWVHGQWH